MLLSACSEGADPIGPWAVDSTCNEGQVVERRAVGAGPSVWGTCSEGVCIPIGDQAFCSAFISWKLKLC